MLSQPQLMQLLSNMHSPENDVRRAAEAEYESIVQANPAWMMHALSEVCATTEDTALVTMTLILLRKVFNLESKPFEHADAATQGSVKTRLLQVLGTAAFGPQRGSAAACVSTLAVKVYQLKQDWTELWENIFTILGAAESANQLKTVCCEIISATAVTMCDYFRIHADALVAGLHNCLQLGSDAKVLQNAAFETVIKLAPLDFKKKLNPLVPVMLNVIQDRLNAQDWDTAETLTSCIAEGISDEVELFEGHTVPLLTGMMQVASTPSVNAGARHMAIEALLTYCETEPKLVRKVPQFATSFFELLFQYTLHPVYDDDWDVTEMKKDEEELEEDSDQVIGSAALDRIALALRGRKLQTTAHKLFAQHIHSSDWQARNAAVLLVCYIGEGMQSVFKSELNNLVNAVVPLINDPVKYVRASALDCISQFSVDFAPTLQHKLYSNILPAVIAAVHDPVPHVASCAARCLDSFFDSIVDDDDDDDDDHNVVNANIKSSDANGKDTSLENLESVECFAPYVPQVCEECVQLMRTTQLHFVRESALGALSSLTSTCKSLLSPYVNALVPIYQEVLSMPDSPEVMSVKCKAIECVTLLACGVGKEVFAPYTKSVCDYLTQLCANGLRNDDSRFRFVLRGWTCMVECLHADVLPYLPHVMQMLLAMMNLECDAVVVNAEVGEKDDDDGHLTSATSGSGSGVAGGSEEGIETCRFIIPGVGEKVARFHTGLIEDKELASNVVNAMLQELGILLSPYFNDIVKSALELLNFTVNSSIRENGALILKEIIDACEEHQAPESQQLAAVALGPLVTALAEESENDVMETMMDVLAGCISIYPEVINQENVQMVSDKLLATLQVMIKSRTECLVKKTNENDEDEIDALDEQDEELQSNIRSAFELIGTMLEKTSAVFAPLFLQNFFPFVSAWLQPHEDDFNVTRALAIICDFVEHVPQYVTDGLHVFCSAAIEFASTRKDEDLLQSAFYLMNLLASYFASHPETMINNNNNVVGGAAGAATSSNAVQVNDFILHAQKVIACYLGNRSIASSEEYEHCTCNALSVYVTLLQYYGQTILQAHAAEMLNTLIAFLPATGDVTEAVRVHDRMLSWVTQSHPLLTLVPGSAHAILMKLKSSKPYYFSEAAREALKTM